MSNLPKLSLPTYEVELPSGTSIKYRPFMVKERAVLLLALQEADPKGILNSVNDLFTICTFGKCNLFEMPIVDAEFLFVKIRNKSVGEELPIIHTCSCGKENDLVLNMDKIEVEGVAKDTRLDMGNNMWVKMRYPTLKDSSVLSENPTEDEIMKIISLCLDTIIVGEESYKASASTPEELADFVKSMTQLQITKIETFFREIPKVVLKHKYTCSCGKENTVTLEGLQNFFG